VKSFKNKVALITGASSGIGESIALALAAEGANLELVARDRERLEHVRDLCIAKGAQVHLHFADVADETQMEKMAADVHTRHAAIDILVNNAGVVMGGFTWEVETADWRRLHDINVMGVVHGIRAFVPKMIERKQGGHVVNISSVSGLVGVRGMGTYSASKFAVVGMSESLRMELHRFKIGVSVICPGYVKTPIQSKVKMVGILSSPDARARVDKDFTNTKLMPETVAQRTLQAIRRNEFIASIGREAVMVGIFKRWAPSLLERALRG
jgi:NADP-dependent 3-hydroxy acid dehydrogenase YdfG